MVVNQLFNRKPSFQIIDKILKAFGLKDLNDRREFCELDLEKNNTLLYLKSIENEIKDYYIPCKQKKYINESTDITNKTAITIFKQFLKTYDYDLFSHEKFIKGKKYQLYKVVSKIEKICEKNKYSKKGPQEIIISWD
jgi:hypothetical protein